MDQRFHGVLRILDSLRRLQGRPGRVLHLDCGDGAVSVGLAERGAIVEAVDPDADNIARGLALAREHSGLAVRFELKTAGAALGAADEGEHDMIVALGLHALARTAGADAARTLVAESVRRAGILVGGIDGIEGHAGDKAPDSFPPASILDVAPFVHQVLIPPPDESSVGGLFVASGRFWLLDDAAGVIDEWRDSPHRFAGGVYQQTRRYFFSKDCIVKVFRLANGRERDNHEEIEREAAFLADPAPGIDAPRLVTSGVNAHEVWLVRERIPGELLVDAILSGRRIDPMRVVRDVLDQAAALERNDLYHRDIRPWNVLLEPDGRARLLDYGSIGRSAADCVWPDNIFLSFFIFVRDVATGTFDPPDPIRRVSISPYNLPPPFQSWAMALWKRPLAEWTFATMRQLLDSAPADEAPQAPTEIWAQAMENAVDSQSNIVRDLGRRIETVERRLEGPLPFEALRDEQRKALAAAEQRLKGQIGTTLAGTGRTGAAAGQPGPDAGEERNGRDAAIAERDRLAARVVAVEAELRRARLQLAERARVLQTTVLERDAALRELHSLWFSHSWRWTRPLREAGAVLRRVRNRILARGAVDEARRSDPGDENVARADADRREPTSAAERPPEPIALTPASHDVVDELKQAIADVRVIDGQRVHRT